MPRRRIILADLDRPPDTSTLVACDDDETAAAIANVTARLLRRRRSLFQGNVNCGVDKVAAALRRLQTQTLGAYRNGNALLLSEPFNAIPSAITPAERTLARSAARIMFGGAKPPSRVVGALAKFGEPALTAATHAGIRFAIVPEGRRYAEYSSAVAKLIPGIDDWSAPPSGLFVVEERCVLLRSSAMAMTAAHEFAHALDAVIADRPRSYFSYESQELRHYFATATGFVNEYAASGLDEYFAESVRAYLEINDARCAWLPLTRRDLSLRDPRMFALIERLFTSALTARERRRQVRI